MHESVVGLEAEDALLWRSTSFVPQIGASHFLLKSSGRLLILLDTVFVDSRREVRHARHCGVRVGATAQCPALLAELVFVD